MSTVLAVERLGVRFPREGLAPVREVSFAIDRGRTLCIIGESGCGKSLTLRALIGLLPPGATTTGTVRLVGDDITALPAEARRRLRGARIGMVFQEPAVALDPVYPIGRQLTEAILAHRSLGADAAHQRALALLELVALPDAPRRLHAYPHELSGGMRQRAMIAIALACEPDVLLADEPTTALDVTVQMQILLLLRELQARLGMSVIFVTHDIAVAAEIADDVAVMYAGSVVELGPAADVLLTPRHPYTRALLESRSSMARRGVEIPVIPGAPPDPAHLPDGCAFHPRCRQVAEICRASPPPSHAAGAQWRAWCWQAADPKEDAP